MPYLRTLLFLLALLSTLSLQAQRNAITLTLANGESLSGTLVDHDALFTKRVLQLKDAGGKTTDYAITDIKSFQGPEIGSYVSSYFEPVAVSSLVGSPQFLKVITTGSTRLLRRRLIIEQQSATYTKTKETVDYFLVTDVGVFPVKDKRDVLRRLNTEGCDIQHSNYQSDAYELGQLIVAIDDCRGAQTTNLEAPNDRRKGMDWWVSASVYRSGWASEFVALNFTEFKSFTRPEIQLGIAKSLGNRFNLIAALKYSYYKQRRRSTNVSEERFQESGLQLRNEFDLSYGAAGLGLGVQIDLLRVGQSTLRAQFLLDGSVGLGARLQTETIRRNRMTGASGNPGESTEMLVASSDTDVSGFNGSKFEPTLGVDGYMGLLYYGSLGNLTPFVGIGYRYSEARLATYQYREIGLTTGFQF